MSDSCKQQWFAKSFEEDYLKRYAHRTDAAARAELPFVLAQLNLKRGARVLDLCCGAGRHSRAMAAAGLCVVGVDLSADLLRAAAAKTAGRKRIIYARADMRRLPLQPEQFDGGVNLFTSFGYFSTDMQNEQALHEAARVLKSGARFVMDFMNAPHVIKHLVAVSERDVDGECLTERRWYDKKTKRLIKTASGCACGEPVERYESVRAFTPAELTAMFARAGLKVLGKYGSLSGEKYTVARSQRCVLVGEKK